MSELTVGTIISVVTTVVAYILGELAKKYEYIEKNQIPLQNLLVGVVAGLFSYMAGLTDNVITSIIICFVSAFGAGGIYDFTKTKGENNNEY